MPLRQGSNRLALLLLHMSKFLLWYPLGKKYSCALSIKSASKLADCCHVVDCCLFCMKMCTAQLAHMDPLKIDADWACDNAYADAL